MKLRTIAGIITLGSVLFAGSALAYDCTGLPKWKRQAYYLPNTVVQYQEVAYVNDEPSKRDFPDEGDPWECLGDCDSTGGGGGGEKPVDPDPEPISIYGAWHCGNDYCTWASVRVMDDFDEKNHWLIDRGNDSGYPSETCDWTEPLSCNPSVNLVVLSFVHPLRLLHQTTEEEPLSGVPIGMTQEVVDYFKDQGVRVMLSIGGITYVDAWNQALADEDDARQLGLNAAAVATALGVGIEIDYEENRNPNLDGLQAFIDAYRSVHPYDATGSNHAARLTIDLAAGDRWLIALTERATREWLNTEDDDLNTPAPVLDYANAMVTPRQSSAEDFIAHWQEHIDGKPQYDPPIPPLAPAKLTGSLWLTGRKPAPECVDFSKSLQQPDATGKYVQTVMPNGAGTTHGMLGYMFWAAECEGTRTSCTTPDCNNTCEGGMGEAAAFYEEASDEKTLIPMEPLRQN
jgi:hypothetical protein